MVKLLVFIGVIVGLMDIAPTEPVSAMMTGDTGESRSDTGESTSDTGPESLDSGTTDTGEDPDTDDTGAALNDSGQADTGVNADADSTPTYSAAELAGEKGGCATAPKPNGSEWLIAVFALVMAGRRR